MEKIFFRSDAICETLRNYIIKKGFRRASEVDLTQSGSTGGFRKSRQSECNKLAQSAKSGV